MCNALCFQLCLQSGMGVKYISSIFLGVDVLFTSFSLLLFRIVENVVQVLGGSSKQYKRDTVKFPFTTMPWRGHTLFHQKQPVLPLPLGPSQENLCVCACMCVCVCVFSTHTWYCHQFKPPPSMDGCGYTHSGSAALCMFKQIC